MAGLESQVERLSLKVDKKPLPSSKTKAHNHPVADSWEEEVEGESCDEEDVENGEVRGDIPSAPPPTPSSPTAHFSYRWEDVSAVNPRVGGTGGGEQSKTTARPEKQTAVAGRLIAGALGVRAPKKTDEQRAYEKAVKEKEIKRRNQEREDQRKSKENAERAKTAVWDD